MLFRLLTIFALFVCSPCSYAASFEAGTYKVFLGDYNDDSLSDVILIPDKRALMLDFNDFTLPIFVGPEPIVLQNTGVDIFTEDGFNRYELIYPADREKISELELMDVNYELYRGDFNGDNSIDLFLLGVYSEGDSQSLNSSFVVYGDSSKNRIGGFSDLIFSKTPEFIFDVVVSDFNDDGFDDIKYVVADNPDLIERHYVFFGGYSNLTFADIRYFNSANIDESTGSAFGELSDYLIPGADYLPELLGAFSVEDDGSSSYSIEIATAPVPSGFSPKIELNYSSNIGNGIVGTGWNLSAGSAIVRCAPNLIDDGYYDPVDLDESDKLCLNGSRLLLVKDDGNTKEYRQEGDHITKIFGYSVTNSVPSWFAVHNPNGDIVEYGKEDSALIATNGAVLEWNIKSHKNVYGEAVEYSYRENAGENYKYLDFIKYGRDQDTYLVHFEYEGRPDIVEIYEYPGVLTKQSLRLAEIRVENVSEHLLWNYKLTYEDEVTTVSPALVQVARCIDQYNCSFPAKFVWRYKTFLNYRQETPFSTTIEENTFMLAAGGYWGESVVEDLSDIHFTDMNGDGIDDLIQIYQPCELKQNCNNALQYSPQTLKIYLSEKDVIKSPDGFGWKLEPFKNVEPITITLNQPNPLLSSNVLSDIKFADFDGDGKKEIFSIDGLGMAVLNGQIAIYQISEDEQQIETQIINVWDEYMGEIKSSQVSVGDYDSDGKSDLFILVRENIEDRNSDLIGKIYFSNGDGYFDSIEVGTFPVQHALIETEYAGYTGYAEVGKTKTGDFNGDGIIDFIYVNSGQERLYLSNLGEFQSSRRDVNRFSYRSISLPDLFEFTLVKKLAIADMSSIMVSDFNGDGYDDIYLVNRHSDNESDQVFLSDGDGNFNIRKSGIKSVIYDKSNPSVDISRIKLADFNSDGRTDIYQVRGTDNEEQYDFIYFAGFDGGFGNGLITNAIKTRISADEKEASYQINAIKFADFIGNGGLGIYHVQLGFETEDDIYLGIYEPKSIYRFMDNPFVSTKVEYDALTYSENYDESLAQTDYPENYISDSFPLQKIRTPKYIVTDVTRTYSDPRTSAEIKQLAHTSIKYKGYRELAGRGSLGFSAVETYDVPNNMMSEVIYSQDYRNGTEGLPLNSESYYLRDNGTSQTIDKTHNLYSNQYHQFPNNTLIRQTYLWKQTVQNWEFTSAELIGTVETEHEYNADGFIKNFVTVTTEPETEKKYVKLVHKDYYPATQSPYLAGKVSRIETTSVVPAAPTFSNPNPGSTMAQDKRVIEYIYDEFGAVSHQIAEPDDAKAITTSFTYTNSGAVKTTTISSGGLSKTTRSEYEHGEYGWEYRKINAKGHVSEFYRQDARYPWLITKSVDPNGFTTESYHNIWGEVDLTIDHLGNSVKSELIACSDSYCTDPDEVYFLITTPNIGKPSYIYFDYQGREVRRVNSGFDGSDNGNKVISLTEYNNAGQVSRRSDPFFDGDPSYWNEINYDELGRMSVTYDPNMDPSIEVSLGARQRMSTNALGQSLTMFTNALGQNVKVVDALQGNVDYGYGPFGELVYTKDAAGTMTFIEYDVFGNKTKVRDQNKGTWSYEHDGFGQLRLQTDAKGSKTWFDYDELGRMVKRIDGYGSSEEVTTIWRYDDAIRGSFYRAAGMLSSVEKNNGAYKEKYSYYENGLAKTKVIEVEGVSYSFTNKYDEFGRLSLFEYPNDFKIKYHYHDALGVLYRITNESEGETYWELKETNARGQSKESWLAGSINIHNEFDPITGYLEAIVASTATGTIYQDSSFRFDKIGNLESRTDNITGITQNVPGTGGYDRLNRLKLVEVIDSQQGQLSQVAIDYYANGNIKEKTDVGKYYYDELADNNYQLFCGNDLADNPGSQAVRKIESLDQSTATYYCYDKNGNMVKQGHRRNSANVIEKQISYTTFDKPSLIDANGQTVTFEYGPSREVIKRIKQSGSNTKVTYSLDGFEVLVEGSKKTFKYHINDSLVVTDENTSSSSKLNIMLKDHQGSVIAILEKQLNSLSVVDRFAYDPWGKRIHTSWLPMDNTSLAQFEDVHPQFLNGYTGHSHVDSAGLIHMGGRLFDPTIGRFLSSDPFVQAPSNTQSFNRYSYVVNNPLSYTDPSGFFFKKIKKAFKRIVKKITKIVKKVVAAHVKVVVGIRKATWSATKRALQNKYVAAAVQIAGCAVGGACLLTSALVSAAASYGATGSWLSAMRAGVTAVATSAVSMGMNGVIGNVQKPIINTILHGAGGAAMSVARGGNARAGFVSGFIAAGSSNMMAKNGVWRNWADNIGMQGRTAIASIVGGLGAKASGGDAAIGALNAGMAHLFNAEPHTESAQERFQEKYGDILKAGHIDIDQNVKDAGSISTQEWLEKVGTGGDWDYKNNQLLIDAGISSARLDEFGNVHFGIVANAHGFNLEGSMYGAGAYQVLRQGGGNPSHLAAATALLSNTHGGYLLPDSISRAMTRAGFTWGDNVGDSINIMNGWDYAQQNY